MFYCNWRKHPWEGGYRGEKVGTALLPQEFQTVFYFMIGNRGINIHYFWKGKFVTEMILDYVFTLMVGWVCGLLDACLHVICPIFSMLF